MFFELELCLPSHETLSGSIKIYFHVPPLMCHLAHVSLMSLMGLEVCGVS